MLTAVTLNWYQWPGVMSLTCVDVNVVYTQTHRPAILNSSSCLQRVRFSVVLWPRAQNFLGQSVSSALSNANKSVSPSVSHAGSMQSDDSSFLTPNIAVASWVINPEEMRQTEVPHVINIQHWFELIRQMTPMSAMLALAKFLVSFVYYTEIRPSWLR